jgi:hypothetical protein
MLIGASIGQAWRLDGWPARANAPGFTAESIAEWQFDKSSAVRVASLRPARHFEFTRTYLKSLFQPPPPKPDIVILKECSSYFPGDVDAYVKSIDKWAHVFELRGIKVIVATVVPVTKVRSGQEPAKLESLLEYNRRIRQYAQEHNLAVLDLQAALQDGSEHSYLRDEFTSGDGSHLNQAAYGVLDQVLRQTLCKERSAPGCSSE